MNTSIQQNLSSTTLQSLGDNERSERFKAKMKILKGLAQDQESLKRQRVELTAALFRASLF